MRIKIMFVAALMVASSVLGSFVAMAQDAKEVTILYWQAASILNPYLSGGTKDTDASALILEPLANYAPDGSLVPVLAEDIPTLENGGISDDYTSITWTFKSDVLWSDGSPLTAEDFIFTWQYCTDPAGGCAQTQYFEDITSIEAVGDNQIMITFDVPKPYPYNAFVTNLAPVISSVQFADCLGEAAASCTEENFAPMGTGPFVIEDFRPNDVGIYVRNENFRGVADGKPYFDRVVLKGGGDAESAARAVLETQEADYAWNLQISPEVLGAMEAAGNGEVVVAFGSNLERIMLNQTDVSPDNPNRSVYMDGENPHPFLTVPEISDAMSLAIDRNIIAEQLYGAAGQAACNIVNGPPIAVSETFIPCEQDMDGAKAILDEAGIVDSDGDGIREYNGIPLSVTYQTSTNAVRQSTQALVKQWWEELGIQTELRNIDASVYFGSDPASPDTYQKFYTDVQMFTSGSPSPDVESFLVRWLCDNAPSPDNGWLGRNVPRACNAEYDALFAEYIGTIGVEARAEMAKQLNDMLIEDGTLIPLVFRGLPAAKASSLGGVDINAWDSEMWNIEDWYRIE
jgi:peptide/nickel transport system substrate-binding protein